MHSECNYQPDIQKAFHEWNGNHTSMVFLENERWLRRNSFVNNESKLYLRLAALMHLNFKFIFLSLLSCMFCVAGNNNSLRSRSHTRKWVTVAWNSSIVQHNTIRLRRRSKNYSWVSFKVSTINRRSMNIFTLHFRLSSTFNRIHSLLRSQRTFSVAEAVSFATSLDKWNDSCLISATI